MSTCNNHTCGFFGNEAFGGYCSVCFKNLPKSEQERYQKNVEVEVPKMEEEKPNTTSFTFDHVPVFIPGRSKILADKLKEQAEKEAEAAAALPQPPKKKEVNRCLVCSKKVGLTGFECRCKAGLFCGKHRYSDKHNCTFDYKAHGKEVLSNTLIGCVAKRIDKL
ncbi:hypothetical protein LAZ67_1000582 [Cordylochernes scorpioides]|uniref:Uncharacterized protein n=1 Tax=Cordylochernes scorpioides TaxID=51811 RepID=A0ABY6JXB3_9ARAC|nr:hypothetical protein LAZ67_1000580 [Cordylochernes scorpioides]UYV60261.1 hypothetical protein LAZ67_1000582 [Cordylochernes scorpioides]